MIKDAYLKMQARKSHSKVVFLIAIGTREVTSEGAEVMFGERYG